MRRFLILFVLCLSIIGSVCAQTGKQNSKIQIVANGGYWRSSGTKSGSQEALSAASKFGCYASLCKVELSKDNGWVMSSGYRDQKPIGDFLFMYKQLVSPSKRSSKDRLEFSESKVNKNNLTMEFNPAGPIEQERSKENPMRVILEFNSDGAKHSEKSLLLLLKKLTKDESIRSIVEFSSSDINLCKAIAREVPDIPLSYTKGDLSPRELNKKGFTGYAVYDCLVLQENPQWLHEANQSEIQLCVSGVQSEEMAKEMLKAGVRRFLTDRVAMMSAWVNNQIPVKLMSFNIRMSGMSELDGDNAWKNRKGAVVKMLESENPDVFGVQEMLPDQQEFLRNSLPAYDMVGVGREDGASEGECMGIFFKKSMFTLMRSGTFWLSETPDEPSLGWDAACKRTVTYVRLKHKASGKTFYYFNTHLDHVGFNARQESVRLICEKIRQLVPDTAGAFILGGDMNCPLTQSIFYPLIGKRTKVKPSDNMEPSESENAKVAKDVTSMEREVQRTPALMKSARNTAWERDNMLTYNGYGKDKMSQIDHILTSQSVNNLMFRTVRDRYGVPYISDHYPITLVFTLK